MTPARAWVNLNRSRRIALADEASPDVALQRRFRAEWRRRAVFYTPLYVFFLVPAVALLIFHYIPIYGVIIAFKDYTVGKGIFESPWNDFEHFQRFFTNPYFPRVMGNTIIISVLRLVFGFPAPILFALLLNEVSHQGVKRAVQTVSYLPHFFSWVVLASILVEVLSPQRGAVGYVFTILGKDAPNLLLDTRFFRPFLIVSGVWQGLGWGAIVYLAALSGVDPQLYESAAVDGANRLQCAVHITLPALVPVMTVLFILSLGGTLNAGFDQIFNFYSPPVYAVADIIDTYIYRRGLIRQEYGYGAAVGLFKNVIGVALVIGTNVVIKRFSEYGIW